MILDRKVYNKLGKFKNFRILKKGSKKKVNFSIKVPVNTQRNDIFSSYDLLKGKCALCSQFKTKFMYGLNGLVLHLLHSVT